MVQIIFGFINKDIYEVLKDNFPEEDQKKIYNILCYTIQKTLPDKKQIKPLKGINQWTPDAYKKAKLQDQIENKQSFISVLYKTNFSAYQKINSLQKYVDIINCKHGINLNINFHYDGFKYTFLLYFGQHSTYNKNVTTLDFDKVNEYVKTYNRVKDILKIEPKIYSFV
jgi:hypothetical protein